MRFLTSAADAAAVAHARLTLVTEEGDALARLDQSDQFVELSKRSLRLHVLVVDAPECVEVASARCRAARLRRAELLQVNISDSVLVERSGKLAFRKTGPA